MSSSEGSTSPESNDAPIISEFADDAEMRELVQMFVDELPERMAAIQTAVQAGQFETAATLCHQLKGAAGGYGFPTITDAAAEVEAASITGEQPVAQAKLDVLKNRCSRARVA